MRFSKARVMGRLVGLYQGVEVGMLLKSFIFARVKEVGSFTRVLWCRVMVVYCLMGFLLCKSA